MAKDEGYIMDLCDRVLGQVASRQHRFDFLRGDRGHRLPVDAYYANLKLAIEYHELQHLEPTPFWDNKPTASGMPRVEQRGLYDQRRCEVLPRHGIALAELCYLDFASDGRKRLLRVAEDDEQTVREKLSRWIDAR